MKREIDMIARLSGSGVPALASSSSRSAGRAAVIRLSDVQPTPLAWLWPGRVPWGMLSVFCGDPGVGKSSVSLDMAARVSSGRSFPDAPAVPVLPASVIVILAEDDLASTVRPRIDALGGDAGRVFSLSGVRRGASEEWFDLGRDLPVLEDEILKTGARLVVIDPLTAFLGSVDAYRDAQVRGLLAPLMAVAERQGVAVLGIMHLGKAGRRRAVYRALGSVAFTAAPRAVWAVAKDPDDADRRILACVKMNVARPADPIAFWLRDGGLVWDSEPVAADVDDLLAAERPSAGGGARREAERFLGEALAAGALPATDVVELARQNGIAERTLKRAKARLGVVSSRVDVGGSGQWVWSSPPGMGPRVPSVPLSTGGPLAGSAGTLPSGEVSAAAP